MRKTTAHNPFNESRHPIYQERLPYFILPQNLARLEHSQAQSPIAENWLVNNDQKFTVDGFFRETSQPGVDLFGENFSDFINGYDVLSNKEERLATARNRLKEKGISDAEFELLLYYSQHVYSVPFRLVAANSGITAFNYGKISHRFFKGSDGFLYYECRQQDISLYKVRGEGEMPTPGKAIPGQIKIVYRFTPNGPEFAYMATSNDALRKLILEQDAARTDEQEAGIVAEAEAEEALQLSETINRGNFSLYRATTNEPLSDLLTLSKVRGPEGEKALQQWSDVGRDLAGSRWAFSSVDPDHCIQAEGGVGRIFSSPEKKRSLALTYIKAFLKTLPQDYREKYTDQAITNWILNNASEAAWNRIAHCIAERLEDSSKYTPHLAPGDTPSAIIGFDFEKGQLYVEFRSLYVFKDGSLNVVPNLEAHTHCRISAEGPKGELRAVCHETFSHNLSLEDSSQCSFVKRLSLLVEPSNVPALIEQRSLSNTSLALIDKRIHDTYDQQAKQYLRKGVAPVDGNISVIPLRVYGEPTGALRPNCVYVFAPLNANGNWFAKFVDPKGVGYEPVLLNDQNLSLLEGGRTSAILGLLHKTSGYQQTEQKIVELATGAYRYKQWHNEYVKTKEIKRRREWARKIKSDLTHLNLTYIGHAKQSGHKFVNEPNFDKLFKEAKWLSTIDSNPLSPNDWNLFIEHVKTAKQQLNDFLQNNLEACRDSYITSNITQCLADLDQFLIEEKTHDREGAVYQEAAAEAWRQGLSGDQQAAVEAAVKKAAVEKIPVEAAEKAVVEAAVKSAVPDFSARCAANPRLLLLFTKHTHLTEKTYLQFQRAYLQIRPIDYGQVIKKLFDRLTFYRSNVFQHTSNAKRLANVQTLRSDVHSLLEQHQHLPEFMFFALHQLEQELFDECSYLTEIADIRASASDLKIPEFQFDSPVLGLDLIPDALKTIGPQIFKDFFEKGKYPLPTLEQLEKYANLVVHTTEKLGKVQKFLEVYLEEIYLKPFNKEAGKRARQYTIEDFRDDATGFLSMSKIPEALRGEPEVYSAILALGIIERFKHDHFNFSRTGQLKSHKNLHNIEDYEAVMTALRGVLERNNNNSYFYEDNHFANGFKYGGRNNDDHSVSGLKSILGEKPHSLFFSTKYNFYLMSDGVQPKRGEVHFGKHGEWLKYTMLNPSGEKVEGQIHEEQLKHSFREPLSLDELNRFKWSILEITSKEGNTVAEPATFNATLAANLDQFEANAYKEYEDQQYVTLFDDRASVLTTTASPDSIVDSNKLIEDFQQQLQNASDIEELNNVEKSFRRFLGNKWSEPISKPTDDEKAIRDIYGKNSDSQAKRRKGLAYLEFFYKVTSLRIKAEEDVEKAKAASKVQEIKAGFEEDVKQELADFLTKNKAFQGQAFVTKNVESVKARFNIVCEQKFASFRIAKQQYCEAILTNVNSAIVSWNEKAGGDSTTLEGLEKFASFITTQRKEIFLVIEGFNSRIENLSNEDREAVDHQIKVILDEVRVRAQSALLSRYVSHRVAQAKGDLQAKSASLDAMSEIMRAAKADIGRAAQLSKLPVHVAETLIQAPIKDLNDFHEALESGTKVSLGREDTFENCAFLLKEPKEISELPGVMETIAKRLDGIKAVGSQAQKVKTELTRGLVTIAVNRVLDSWSQKIALACYSNSQLLNDKQDINLLLREARMAIKTLVPDSLKTAVNDLLRDAERQLFTISMDLNCKSIRTNQASLGSYLVDLFVEKWKSRGNKLDDFKNIYDAVKALPISSVERAEFRQAFTANNLLRDTERQLFAASMGLDPSAVRTNQASLGAYLVDLFIAKWNSCGNNLNEVEDIYDAVEALPISSVERAEFRRAFMRAPLVSDQVTANKAGKAKAIIQLNIYKKERNWVGQLMGAALKEMTNPDSTKAPFMITSVQCNKKIKEGIDTQNVLTDSEKREIVGKMQLEALVQLHDMILVLCKNGAPSNKSLFQDLRDNIDSVAAKAFPQVDRGIQEQYLQPVRAELDKKLPAVQRRKNSGSGSDGRDTPPLSGSRNTVYAESGYRKQPGAGVGGNLSSASESEQSSDLDYLAFNIPEYS